MSLSRVLADKNLSHEFHVIVEIAMNGDPIKFEVDKETDAIFMDRFIMSTAMHYPCNYGYVPQTLAADGDQVDVLVKAPLPLQPGVVLTCRAVGLPRMQDEHGDDNKMLAVPVENLTPRYRNVRKTSDLEPSPLQHIAPFFSHCKELEPVKFVRVGGDESSVAATREITQSVAAYRVKAHGAPQ